VRVVAYLDANTGSMLIGAVAAGMAGVGVAFRVGWKRFKGFFSRKGTPEEAGAPAADDA
jgi:hypothetical protein